MAEFTKGEWQYKKAGHLAQFAVYSGDWREPENIIATGIDTEANASLIVSAVNACVSVNLDNPLAVAEGLGELKSACKDIVANPPNAIRLMRIAKALNAMGITNALSAIKGKEK